MDGQSRNGAIDPESQIKGLFNLAKASMLELHEPDSAQLWHLVLTLAI